MRLGRRAQPQGRDVLLDHVLLTIDGERQEIASRLHDHELSQNCGTAISRLAAPSKYDHPWRSGSANIVKGLLRGTAID